MTENMIERVARALAENQCGKGTPIDDNDRSMARAAIEAMREPTDAMVGAGTKREISWEYGNRGCPDNGPHVPSHAIYVAMIDTALAEQQP